MDRYAKAVVGAILAGLGALATALTDGITATEWVLVAIATLGSFGMVWATKNSDPPAAPLNVPDSVTTVNVDRGLPTATPGDVWTDPAPGAHERLADHT